MFRVVSAFLLRSDGTCRCCGVRQVSLTQMEGCVQFLTVLHSKTVLLPVTGVCDGHVL